MEEDYCVKEGWILLILVDHRRLIDGKILCSDYRIARSGRIIPAAELRKTMLIGPGEQVDLYLRKKKGTELIHIANDGGEVSERPRMKVVAA